MSKTLNEVRDDALANAIEKGFTQATFLEAIMLIVTEAAEAAEDFRNGKLPNESWSEPKNAWVDDAFVQVPGKPCGIPSELADIVIRVAHLAGVYGINLDLAVEEKLSFNKTRPRLHGKII